DDQRAERGMDFGGALRAMCEREGVHDGAFMKLRHWTALPLVLASMFGASAASAQSAGFALDRFDPSDRGSDWFALESLDFDGHMRAALGLVGDYAYKPLVLYNGDGDEVNAIV